MLDPRAVLRELEETLVRVETRARTDSQAQLTVDVSLPMLRRLRDALVAFLPTPVTSMPQTVPSLNRFTTRDIIDVLEVTVVFEQLEAHLQAVHADCGTDLPFALWVCSDPSPDGDPWDAQLAQYRELRRVLQELTTCAGGDLCWRGQWYPATLIADTAFARYVREELAEFGTLDVSRLASWLVIDWVATVDNLRLDYSEVEWNGRTYLFR